MMPIAVRNIMTTSVLYAEPPKKKRKLDVQILKLRHERKIRKLEKAIRQLKKTPRQLKPIEEYKLPPALMRELEARRRPITEDDEKVIEMMNKMSRLWISYNSQRRRMEQQAISRVVASQQKALDILRRESPDLYSAAVAIDPNFLPLEDEHLLTETAPNPEFTPEDGTKTDISKVWAM